MEKYVDINATVQIIGTLINTPSLMNQTDKYWFIDDDFPNEFHQIVFGTIYRLFGGGTKNITLEAVEDYLQARPRSEAIFQQNNGEEFFLKAKDNAQVDAFNFYYNRLKKMTLLRGYDKIGMDISFIYDPNNIMDMAKKERQENWLDNHSLEEIADEIDNKILSIRQKYTSEDFSETSQAGSDILNLIEKFKTTPEVGIPMYGNLINTVTRGARLKKFYLRSAPSGWGKAIPNDTIIPTSQGDRKVSDIKVGDYLFGQDGYPTKVLNIYPQDKPKEIYEVTFEDGRKAKCCENHLWEYYYKGHEWKPRVEDTKTIIERTKNLKNGFKNSDNKGYRFKIKINEPLQYPVKNYKISPYAMGLIIGDGSFRYNNTNKAFMFSSSTDELPSYLGQELNLPYKKTSDFNFNYYFKKDEIHNLWVEELLEDYPEMWQLKSYEKFIPQEYLQGSIDQRYSLLQGLLDTDGSIDSKGRVSFTTTSRILKEQIIKLVYELGMFASCSEDKRTEKYTTGECFNIHIQCKKELKPKLFRLSNKKETAIKYAQSNKRSEHKEFNSIVSIEPTGQFTEMTCFTVDNEQHLFLMNDCIVTHNTRTNIADACFFACDRIYDPQFGWIKNGTKNPTLFISTELELEEVQTMMLAFLSNVNEEHILNGRYEDDEEERIARAAEIISDSPLYITTLPDFSIRDIENTIRSEIREHKVQYVVHDYIHTSMKILEEITKRSGGVKLREDNILFMLSTKLKDLCNLYGIFLLSSTQLSADWKDCNTPDQNLLRGSKAIADKIDYGAITLPVTKDDLKALEGILDNFAERPNQKISVYKNRRGKYKGIYLWCYSDLGTCRVNPIFATDWSYDMIKINNVKIEVKE